MRWWRLVQTILWTVVLGFAGWKLRDEPRLWVIVIGSSLLISWLTLCAILRTSATPANGVTAFRFLALVALLLKGYGGPLSWGLWLLLIAVISLDLLDGWCARRYGSTPSGPLFDMESDQFATICLTTLIATTTTVGTWPLLLPGFKYLFEVVFFVFGSPDRDTNARKGEDTWARIFCAIAMIGLLGALAPFVGSGLKFILAFTAVMLIGWSFSREGWEVIRRRFKSGDVDSKWRLDPK